ncbi:MAG: hypothetical protein ACOC23_07945 [Thermodesulfobacteriota bacterium]
MSATGLALQGICYGKEDWKMGNMLKEDNPPVEIHDKEYES